MISGLPYLTGLEPFRKGVEPASFIRGSEWPHRPFLGIAVLEDTRLL